MVENATGSACEQDIDYYPYGAEQWDYCGTPVAQNYKFSGKERDTESGLDNFGARYNASNLGRFMTPDWAAKPVTVPYANFGDPQSLNLYIYVENAPLSRIDAVGHAEDLVAAASDHPAPSESSMGLSEQEAAQLDWTDPPQAQATAAAPAQNSGEGSQANLDRRAAIANTAEGHDGDTSMPYTPGRPTCNLFVQRDIAEAGAPKPEVTKADGSKGAPGAAEWAGSKIPGWRILGPNEKPQPGDVAARKENFSDATGHSGIVTAVSKTGVVTVMAAHATKIGVDMSFQPASKEFSNHYQRYTGD